jgi:hypothetical protein
MGEITKTLEPHTEGDPIGVLLSLMTMYSVAVGTGPTVRVGNDPHPLTVWTILVGETNSGRKGTATGEAKRIFKRACPGLMDPKTHLIASGVASGAALVSEMHNRAIESGWFETIPVDEDSEGSDALAIRLSPGYQSLIIASEYASILKRSRIDDSLGQNLRVAWEGDTLSNITKKETHTVYEPHLGVIGHITPGELAASLSASDLAGGSANRFLWAYVRRNKSLPHGGTLSKSQSDDLVNKFKMAVEHALTIKGDVPMDQGAWSLWGNEMYEGINSLVSVGGKMESFAGRGVPYVKRLAALYALSDQRDKISVDDLRAAEGVVKYMIESVRYVTADSEHEVKTEVIIPIDPTGEKIKDNDPTRLLKFILEEGGEVTRAIACRQLNRRVSALDEAAYRLGGSVVKVRIPTGSRPSLAYRYVGPPLEEEDAAPQPVIREAVKASVVPDRKRPKTKPRKTAESPFVAL